MTTKLCHHAMNILLALLLTSCMAVQSPAIGPGDVLTVQQGQVIYGIQQALAGKPGTALLMDPTGKYFLASWPCSGNQAWAFITENIETWLGKYSGNLAKVQTWEEVKAQVDQLAWGATSASTFLKVMGARTAAVISRTLPLPLLLLPAMLDPAQIIMPGSGPA